MSVQLTYNLKMCMSLQKPMLQHKHIPHFLFIELHLVHMNIRLLGYYSKLQNKS